VTIQSKVYVCGGSIAGIVGPNPAGGKNVLLSCFLGAVKAVDYATSWSLTHSQLLYRAC